MSWSQHCWICFICQVPYSGKLSQEKTFVNWWTFCRENFHRLLAGAANCTTEGHHASKLVEKTFTNSHETSKFAKVFSLESFLLHQYHVAGKLAIKVIFRSLALSYSTGECSAHMFIAKPLKVTLQATYILWSWSEKRKWIGKYSFENGLKLLMHNSSHPCAKSGEEHALTMKKILPF